MKKNLHINHVEPLIGEAEVRALTAYMRSGGFLTEHTRTKEFEEQLAKFLKVPYVSCVPNGTAALYLSLLAAGVGPGDEVLVPDLTMIATPNAVKMVGATPIFVDIDDEHCLDLSEAEVSVKTKAMIYVDLNGRSGNMNKVRKFCRTYNLALIEDACQALGSEWEGQYLGTFGRFGCFSLGFHKIITTGQGGFIVTHTKEDYEAIERLKDFGRVQGGNDIHDYVGYNFKFTDLQAVIGIEQLKTIKQRMAKKRKLYEWYHGVVPPKGYVPWFIEISFENRDEVAIKMRRKGIETRPMYPAIHTQKIYRGKGFPMATAVADSVLWMPSSLNLTKKTVEYIIQTYANI